MLHHSRVHSNLPITVRTKFTLSHRMREKRPIGESGRKRITSLDVWLEEKQATFCFKGHENYFNVTD